MPRVFTPLYNISDTNIKKIISTDPFEVILRPQIILPFTIYITYGSRYSRMDRVKFV